MRFLLKQNPGTGQNKPCGISEGENVGFYVIERSAMDLWFINFNLQLHNKIAPEISILEYMMADK